MMRIRWLNLLVCVFLLFCSNSFGAGVEVYNEVSGLPTVRSNNSACQNGDIILYNTTSKKWFCSANMGAPTPGDTGTGTTLAGPREYYYCSGTCTVTLPNGPAAGSVYEFCILNLPGVSTAITLSAATNRYYGKPDQSGYGTQTTGTLACTAAAGNKLCVISVDATHYMVASYNGTCTAN
jgi:hypothetical protein